MVNHFAIFSRSLTDRDGKNPWADAGKGVKGGEKNNGNPEKRALLKGKMKYFVKKRENY